MKMWAIYKQTIRNRRLSWLIYSAIGLGLLFLYIATFPAIQQQQAMYDQLLNSMPKGILEAFNITKSAPSLMGFFTAKHFGFTWDLMMIFLMTAYAGGAIAKEIDTRTMGLLLALPISRLKLYAVRLAAGISGLLIFVGFSELLLWPIARLSNYAIAWGDVANVGLLGFLFGFAVLGLGMMFSALTRDTGKTYGAMSAILLLMYVLNIVAGLEDKVANLKYASLFHYFNPGSIIDGGHLDTTALFVLGGAGLISAALGAYIFNRRDISV